MQNFKVTLPGGETYEVKASSPDIIKWERTTKGAYVARLGEEARMTDLVAIAYHASIRHGLFTGKLEDFETSADVEPLGDGEDADPFQQAA
jgi:hypothetical protein